MAEKLLLVGLCAILGLIATACKPQEPDFPATIQALKVTITELQRDLVTHEAAAIQSPAPMVPSPTLTSESRSTLALPTPQPVTTVRRPPTATPSPAPTGTPTNTPTATPIPDAAVRSFATNLRSSPGVGFAILEEVPPGAPLNILGKSADGEWLKVVTPSGAEGWMYYLPLDLYISLDAVEVVE